MKPFTLWTKDIRVFHDLFTNDNGVRHSYITYGEIHLVPLMYSLHGHRWQPWRKQGRWMCITRNNTTVKQYIVK